MTILVSFVVNEDMGFKRFKAPHGFMYEITDIHFSVLAAVNNRVYVIGYDIEEKGTSTDIAASDVADFIAIMETEAIRQQSFHFSVAEKVKYLLLAQAASGNAFECSVVIVGRLTKASKTELLMEWFRKGR